MSVADDSQSCTQVYSRSEARSEACTHMEIHKKSCLQNTKTHLTDKQGHGPHKVTCFKGPHLVIKQVVRLAIIVIHPENNPKS